MRGMKGMCNEGKLQWGELTQMSQNPPTILYHNVLWQMKNKMLFFCKAYGHQTWQGGSLWYKGNHAWNHMHYSPITRSSAVTRQNKNVISALLQGVWPPNVAGWWLMGAVTCPWSCVTIWSRVNLRSRDKLKTKYLVFGKVCNYQTNKSHGSLIVFSRDVM